MWNQQKEVVIQAARESMVAIRCGRHGAYAACRVNGAIEPGLVAVILQHHRMAEGIANIWGHHRRHTAVLLECAIKVCYSLTERAKRTLWCRLIYYFIGRKFRGYNSGASRMRAGQGICVPRQGILGHFRPLLDIFGAKGLFKDTFLFEGRGCIPPPP